MSKKRTSRASATVRKSQSDVTASQEMSSTSQQEEGGSAHSPTHRPALEVTRVAATVDAVTLEVTNNAEEADAQDISSAQSPKVHTTPASSSAEVARGGSLFSSSSVGVSSPVSMKTPPGARHQQAKSPTSTPPPFSSSNTTAMHSIATTLDSFISSPECWGQLQNAWSKMGYCPATQSALVSTISNSVVAHVTELVSQQVEIERCEAAKVEMLFDECLLLSQRLNEQVINAPLAEMCDSILHSTRRQATTACEEEEGDAHDKTKERRIVRLVGGVSDSYFAHNNNNNNKSKSTDGDFVTAPMPNFSCSGPTQSCPSAMLSPKSDHATRPTGGATTTPLSSPVSTPSSAVPTFAFLSLPHAKQLEVLGVERRRFSRMAEERVEYLRLIYCSRRLLDVPVRKQEELRAGYAKSLFEHMGGEELRADSMNSSGAFFTPSGSPRVTTNQIECHGNDFKAASSTSLPEVVTAAVRAVSRLRSLSVTARAYPADHPLYANTSHQHNEVDESDDLASTGGGSGSGGGFTTAVDSSFDVNDSYCQAILTKGARQDLSMDRIHSEANAVTKTLLKYVRSMLSAIKVEASSIEALEKELGSAAPPTDSGMRAKASIKAALSTFGGISSPSSSHHSGEEDASSTLDGDSLSESLAPIFDSQFDQSVLYHQFPECVARLFTIRLPTNALLDASSERERLQVISYDSAFVKFAEAQHAVWGAYKSYYTTTGDQAYASPPDYSDVLITTNNKNNTSVTAPSAGRVKAESEVAEDGDEGFQHRGTANFGSCKSDIETSVDFSSTLTGDGLAFKAPSKNVAFSPTAPPFTKSLAHQAKADYEAHQASIARLVSTTSKYTEALSTVVARMDILNQIEPLLKRRDCILQAQSTMQAGSKERLLSRSVNMAKQLREEESLRKMIHKDVPNIISQVVGLCDAWERLTRSRMIINSKDVLRVVSGMSNEDSTSTPRTSEDVVGTPRPTQYIYGVEGASHGGGAATTPGSRLGSPVPGSTVKREAPSRSPAPQLPRRQMSSQIPSPSPQPKGSRAATPIIQRNLSRVGGAPSLSPRPRSGVSSPQPAASARGGPPPSAPQRQPSSATRPSRVNSATNGNTAPRSAEMRVAQPSGTTRGASSAPPPSRSLAQPPSRALSRSKAISPSSTRPASTINKQTPRGTAVNPVQHPARSQSPQPTAAGGTFTRPPPLGGSTRSPAVNSPRTASAKKNQKSVVPYTKRSRSLTPTSTRDGMAPPVCNLSRSAQPRSPAMSPSRQALHELQGTINHPLRKTSSGKADKCSETATPTTTNSSDVTAATTPHVPSVFVVSSPSSTANTGHEQN